MECSDFGIIRRHGNLIDINPMNGNLIDIKPDIKPMNGNLIDVNACNGELMDVKEIGVVENGVVVGRKAHLQERLDRLELLYRDTRQELEATREGGGGGGSSGGGGYGGNSGGTFKIFVGNLSDLTSPTDLREAFGPFGVVVEADVLKNYGFVHMLGEEEGLRAITALNGRMLNGKPLIVAVSTCGRRSNDHSSHYRDSKPERHRHGGGGGGGSGGNGSNFKIFVGNLSHCATSADIRNLFEQYGTIAEADVITARGVKTYGFVHMVSRGDGEAAIAALNGYVLHGRPMVVAASTGTRRSGPQRIKIFVGNVSPHTTTQELRSLFQSFGNVVEADILSNYAFVHMDNISQGKRAIRELDGYELHGSNLSVQESRSQPFQQHSASPLPPAEPQFNRAPASHPQSYYREPPPPDPCPPPAALYEPQYSRPPSYYRGRYDPYLPLPAPHHPRGWGEEHRENYFERYPDQPPPNLDYACPPQPPSPPRFSSQRPF